MLQHHLRHRPVEGDGLQDVVPGLRVRLDQLELVGAQPAGLGEDLRRHRDLAHVVDERGETQRLQLLAVHAHAQRDGDGQLGDPALVPGSVGIAPLDRVAHGDHRALHGAAQPLGMALQLPLRLMLLGDVEHQAPEQHLVVLAVDREDERVDVPHAVLAGPALDEVDDLALQRPRAQRAGVRGHVRLPELLRRAAKQLGLTAAEQRGQLRVHEDVAQLVVADPEAARHPVGERHEALLALAQRQLRPAPASLVDHQQSEHHRGERIDDDHGDGDPLQRRHRDGARQQHREREHEHVHGQAEEVHLEDAGVATGDAADLPPSHADADGHHDDGHAHRRTRASLDGTVDTGDGPADDPRHGAVEQRSHAEHHGARIEDRPVREVPRKQHDGHGDTAEHDAGHHLEGQRLAAQEPDEIVVDEHEHDQQRGVLDQPEECSAVHRPPPEPPWHVSYPRIPFRHPFASA